MQKYFLIAAIATIPVLSSCKKDTCTIYGETFSCEEAYDHKCSKAELEEFQNECKEYGGKLTTK